MSRISPSIYRDVEAEGRPEADEHRNQQQRVFDLAVDREMLTGREDKSDNKADGDGYLRTPPVYLDPYRAKDDVEHELQ